MFKAYKNLIEVSKVILKTSIKTKSIKGDSMKNTKTSIHNTQIHEFIKNNYEDLNLKIFLNNSRLVIEHKRREIFSYYPKDNRLLIKEPMLIHDGLKLIELFNTFKITNTTSNNTNNSEVSNYEF